MPPLADQRASEAKQIREAYLDAEAALSRVGNLLRTTEAGRAMWSARHKSAATGLRVVIETLRRNVPNYI